jgi:hypothetical protein
MIRFDAYRDGFLNARLTRSFTNAVYHASGREYAIYRSQRKNCSEARRDEALTAPLLAPDGGYVACSVATPT